MAIYTFKNSLTEEVKEFWFPMSELDEQTAELGDKGWTRVFEPMSIVSTTGTIGKMDQGFNDRLQQIKSVSGRGNTINVK